MSYCRFSEGDVYLYQTTEDHWECCACSLAPLVNGSLAAFGDPDTTFLLHSSTTLSTLEQVLEHLNLHKNNNDLVPNRAFNRVQEELRRSKLNKLNLELNEYLASNLHNTLNKIINSKLNSELRDLITGDWLWEIYWELEKNKELFQNEKPQERS